MQLRPHGAVGRRTFLRVAGLAAGGVVVERRPALMILQRPLFVAVDPARSGITWSHTNAMWAERYLPETCGSGCKFIDFDNDGWMDLYLVNSGPSDFFGDPAAATNRLYRNNRDGTFTELKESHTNRAGWGWSVAFFDADNDTDLDLYAANGWITNKNKDDL